MPLHSRPEHVGGAGRRRVVALPLQEVGPVDRGGRHVEQHLARPGLGVGDLAVDQHLGAAGAVGDDRRIGRGLRGAGA